MHPGKDRFRSSAQRLADDRNAPGHQAAHVQRSAVQLQCDRPLQAEQCGKKFSGPAKTLPQQAADHPAAVGKTSLRADAACHADGKVALQQRLQPEGCALRQKAQAGKQQPAGRSPCIGFAARDQNPAVNRQKAGEVIFPVFHSGAKALCQCGKVAP